MLKILTNLKSSFLSVLAIVVLLVIQADADLALPGYTSKIVNIGIQQAGIENVSPEVIRKSTLDNILLFTNDREEILNNYYLVESKNNADKNYQEYVKKYPILETEDLYIKNKIDSKKQEELNNIFSKPIMIYVSLTNKEYSEIIKNQIISIIPEKEAEEFNQMDIIDIVKNMNQEQVDYLVKNVDEMLNKLPGTMIDQAAIEAIKKEYEIIGIDMFKFQSSSLIRIGLQMLGVALISMICAVLIILLSSRVAAKFGREMREKVFRKVLSFSSKEFREFSTASLITRNTNDIQQIQQLLAIMFRVVVYAPIMGIGGFLRVLNNSNMSMAWIIGVAVLIILFIVLILFIIAMPKFKKLQMFIDKVNGVSREILTGLPVIRAFSREEYEEDRFEKQNKKLMKINIFVNSAMSIMMPALMLVMNGMSILIIWVGAKNVNQGVMQVGDIMAFIQYTIHIVISFIMISMVSIFMPRASVSANRINEVLEKENSINDPKDEKEFDKSKKGLVEFKDVSFKYPDAEENILEHISFTANPGETTAIIGSTGSRKINSRKFNT